MRKQSILSIAAILLSASIVAPATPASAQQFMGYDGFGQPICSGPLGPGPCADVHRYLQQQQMAQRGGWGGPAAPGMANLPGAGMLPRDGQIVASIYQSCGGEPSCMAVSWGAVEVQRCRNGFGVPGGCFGPNGEIMKVVNRFLPQHLHPNVIIRNVESDIRNGPGRNNDVVGCNGWLAKRIGVSC
ncbi:MAG: hypothetical protein M3Q08_01840 [Pseudomonadota bacterium]|nr:hypothetical protein [Pseudomonadota bacterium]